MPARVIGDASVPLDGEECEPAEVVPEVIYHNDKNDVVVSGISCRLPESDNMEEFRENLMNGHDMVTENNRRWEPGE